MRAGPLSYLEVIESLNEKFVNTWVLLRELPELIGGVKGEVASLVAKKLQHHYTDSVDILVLTSEAEVLAHQPDRALPYRNRAQHYLTLLQRSLEVFEGELLSKLEAKPISLGRKLKEVLHIFHASGTEIPDYTPIEIDLTPFEHGGILHIEIQVGGGEATGSFGLYNADTELSNKCSPDDNEALAGSFVPPGGTGHIFHGFKQGRHFKLAATSFDTKEGSTNAFIARISVVLDT